MKKTSNLSLFSVIVPLAFAVNLGVGMTSPDVVSLQKILNSSPDTMIAASGPGSPGNETAYFGELTRQAVIRFQNKYAHDILYSSGLTQGNGYVGPSTRKKLEEVSKSISSADTGALEFSVVPKTKVTTGNSDPLERYQVKKGEKIDVYVIDKKIEAMQQKMLATVNTAMANLTAPAIDFGKYSLLSISKVLLFQFSVQQATAGTAVTLSGHGLDPASNDLYFGTSYKLTGIKAEGSMLGFTVPPLPAGRYDVVIKNKNGQSNSLPFVVRDQTSADVKIIAISPKNPKYGDTVTVTGVGFAEENNEVVLTFDRIKGIPSSDGKTLSFRFAPKVMEEMSKLPAQNKLMNVGLDIINDNGVTKYSYMFKMSI